LYYRAINEVWNSVTDHTVIKGLNVHDAARVMREKWDRFNNPVAIGLDATKFDMHVGVGALGYEHEFYNRVFKSKELKQLLSWQLNNKGVAYCPDGVVKFKIPGTRCSGDLNTSLGNCILMCALIYCMCEQLGVVAELANNGDDCVLILDRIDEARVCSAIQTYFGKAGFRMVVEQPVYVFEEIEFCQSKPVLCAGKWTMIRNVRTCMKKDVMCLVPIQNNKVWLKWLGAVGNCGLATVPGCPVLQSFYTCFKRSGINPGAKFTRHVFKNTSMMERITECLPEPVTDHARASFFYATGITPAYQIELERYYDRMTIGSLEPGLIRARS